MAAHRPSSTRSRTLTRRSLLAGLSATSAGLVLAACGGQTPGPNAGPTAAPKAAEPTKPTAQAAAPTSAAAAQAPATTAPAASTGGLAGRPFNVGFTPGEDAEVVLRRFEPLITYLKSATGMEIKGFAGTDYSATIEAMKARRVEAANFGPFSYILAADVANARALVMPGLPDGTPNSYHSLIVANTKAGIGTLEDLRGRSFSFVDPASTSGHLIPRTLLLKAGLDPDKDLKPIFAGGHDASLLAINGGKVDAGAVSDSQFKRMVEAKVIDEANVAVVATSDPIPSSPFTTRGDLEPEVRERVRDALLLAHENLPEDVVRALVGSEKNRYIVADDALYNPLRETAKILNLDLATLQ